ncbi:MAG TPA: hypothetical protein VGL41_01660, partial [Roseiarcus sp.]
EEARLSTVQRSQAFSAVPQPALIAFLASTLKCLFTGKGADGLALNSLLARNNSLRREKKFPARLVGNSPANC